MVSRGTTNSIASPPGGSLPGCPLNATCQWSSDDAYLAMAAGDSRTLQVIDAASGKHCASLENLTFEPNGLDEFGYPEFYEKAEKFLWNPREPQLAAVCRDGIRVFDAKTGKQFHHEGCSFYDFSWNADGSTLLIDEGSSCLVMHAHSGKHLFTGRSFRGWSPDGKRLLMFAEQQFSLLDSATGKLVRKLGPGSSYAWNPNSKTLAFIDEHGRVSVVDATTGEQRPIAKRKLRSHMSWSYDGSQLLIYSRHSENSRGPSKYTMEIANFGLRPHR